VRSARRNRRLCRDSVRRAPRTHAGPRLLCLRMLHEVPAAERVSVSKPHFAARKNSGDCETAVTVRSTLRSMRSAQLQRACATSCGDLRISTATWPAAGPHRPPELPLQPHQARSPVFQGGARARGDARHCARTSDDVDLRPLHGRPTFPQRGALRTSARPARRHRWKPPTAGPGFRTSSSPCTTRGRSACRAPSRRSRR